MRSWLYRHRFMVARRCVQVLILGLYIAGNVYGWTILKGNLSSSLLFGTIPLADPFALIQMLSAGAAVGMNVILGALVIAFFYMVIAGRAFCSWVCPVNAVTDAANGLRRVLSLDKYERKVWLGKEVRYWVLGLSLLISLLSGVAAFELVSPIGMMHRGIVFGMGMGFAALLTLFFFDLFALKHGWCGHVCPVGAFYSLIGTMSIVRIKHDQAQCTLCMKCKAICPEKQVLSIVGKESGTVVFGECTRCGRCVEVCEDNALSFGVRSYITTKTGEEK